MTPPCGTRPLLGKPVPKDANTAYETGKVIDYIVLSKYCAGCSLWEKQDKLSDEYKDWKASLECDANFSGSAGAMEPQGTVLLIKRSLDFNVRYMNLVSDGDSKTMSLLQQEMPYRPDPDHQVKKMDCVGHVQKRMGTALHNLKVQYRGQKLSDGKTIGGVGRLTDSRINSLQNYYGDTIHRNKGDLAAMMKAVRLRYCTRIQRMIILDIICVQRVSNPGTNGR